MQYATVKAKYVKEVTFVEYDIEDAGETTGFIRVRKYEKMPSEIHLRLVKEDGQEGVV